MNVPLLDLTPQLTELREEIIENVIRVIDSTRYIQGPEVDAFENEIASYCETAHAVGVSSGTDALLASIMALDIGPGDQVLTTPFSFFATMGVILRTGAEPVFADIDPVSFNINPDCIAEQLSDDHERRIKAIIPVHLYGQCAEMASICEIAEKYDVAVIEDAAQAIGAECPIEKNGKTTWRKAGCFGIAGSFSFFPSKNLGGIGDGGMVVTRDDLFAEKIRLLRNHGAHPKYYHAIVGGNFRLDPVQATVLRIKLHRLESWHSERRYNADRYNALLKAAGLGMDERLLTPKAVYANKTDTQQGTGKNHHIYNQYVIRVQQRDELRRWLQDHGVASEIYYPLGLHQQKCLKTTHAIAPMVHAEKAAQEVMALPIYPGLTASMQEYVVETIQAFYK